MAEVKLTKTELREQQERLQQLQNYLPTLQLKKALLQAEIQQAIVEVESCQKAFKEHAEHCESFYPLLDRCGLDLKCAVTIDNIHKRKENIAGVEIACFEKIDFATVAYALMDTPPWVDGIISSLQGYVCLQIQTELAQDKCKKLEGEFREVSIKVNLFEKILIPRALANIKKIKIFLSDQQLAAVCRAKVSKSKIEGQKDAALADIASDRDFDPLEKQYA